MSMSITGVTINNTPFNGMSEPTITKGDSSPNSFTLSGSGFPTGLDPSAITFKIAGAPFSAGTLTNNTTTEIDGTFVYSAGQYGGPTTVQTSITINGGGGSVTFPLAGALPVKVSS